MIEGPGEPLARISCFATAALPDTLVAGRKLVGAAQARRGRGLLQHGSILLDANPDALVALFGVVGPIVTLAELIPQLPGRETLEERLAAGMALALGIALEPGELTPAEAEATRSRMRCGERDATRSPGRRAALDSA
jgi:lipoate-protein ligase A